MRLRIHPSKELTLNIFFLFLTILLFFGGLGIKTEIVLYTGAILGLLMLFTIWRLGKKLKFPNGTLLYVLFISIFLTSLFWSRSRILSFRYLILFIAGGFFWIVAFNLKNKFKSLFEKILIFLGILFGTITIGDQIFTLEPLRQKFLSLVTPFTENHHHIGDFWIVVLLLTIHKVLHKKRYLYATLFLPGIYLLFISQSRSAYIALIVGIVLVFSNKNLLEKQKRFFISALVFVAALFLIIGTQKSILASRPYYLQAINSLIRHPLGVGVGLFGSVSTECSWCPRSFSIFTHNLILEMLVGIGFLSLAFVFWLGKMVVDIVNTKTLRVSLYRALFIALLVNFLFDFTYFIPTTLWLWFVTLGFVQSETR